MKPSTLASTLRDTQVIGVLGAGTKSYFDPAPVKLTHEIPRKALTTATVGKGWNSAWVKDWLPTSLAQPFHVNVETAIHYGLLLQSLHPWINYESHSFQSFTTTNKCLKEFSI